MTSPLRDEFEITGDDQMQSVIQSIDCTGILEDFLNEVAAEKAACFSNQATVRGEPWAPLSATTRNRKRSDAILVETGALKTSLVEIGGSGNVAEVSTHHVRFGTDIPYAIFHETGTGLIPARSFMGVSEALVDKLMDKVTQLAAEKVAQQKADELASAAE
jgi:phage gpG-like protein